MKNFYYTLVLLVFILSSFKVDKACEFAGSNINYVKSQTEKALNVEDINKARYFAYKALNAIEKNKKKVNECGCEYAEESISEGLYNLKLATKATSLNSTRILLNKALENILGGIESLEDHENHGNQYASDVLSMNTVVSTKKNLSKKLSKKEFESTIDLSLEKYRTSLNKVVTSVDCREARAFAERIYTHCEQQLLRTDLPESKLYYNLRTKEITAEALERLEACK